jgi:hypothetical protein
VPLAPRQKTAPYHRPDTSHTAGWRRCLGLLVEPTLAKKPQQVLVRLLGGWDPPNMSGRCWRAVTSAATAVTFFLDSIQSFVNVHLRFCLLVDPLASWEVGTVERRCTSRSTLGP